MLSRIVTSGFASSLTSANLDGELMNENIVPLQMLMQHRVLFPQAKQLSAVESALSDDAGPNSSPPRYQPSTNKNPSLPMPCPPAEYTCLWGSPTLPTHRSNHGRERERGRESSAYPPPPGQHQPPRDPIIIIERNTQRPEPTGPPYPPPQTSDMHATMNLSLPYRIDRVPLARGIKKKSDPVSST